MKDTNALQVLFDDSLDKMGSQKIDLSDKPIGKVVYPPRAYFDKDSGELVIKEGESEREYDTERVQILVNLAKSIFVRYNGEKYESCDEGDKGARESIIAAVTIMIGEKIFFPTFMVTNALCQMIRKYVAELDKLKESLSRAYEEKKIDERKCSVLINRIHLIVAFTPIFKKVSGGGGSYLKVKNIKMSNLSEDTVQKIAKEYKNNNFTFVQILKSIEKNLEAD